MSGKVGKIRRKAYRLHQTLSSPKDTVCNLEDLPKPVSGTQGGVSFNSTLFKNVHIPPEALKQELPSYSKKQKLPTYSKRDEQNFEVKSVVAENLVSTRIGGRRRKIPFYEVVASAKDFLKKREAEKKKKKAFVLNDLEAALPSVEEKGQRKEKPRASKRFGKRNAEMMEDIQAYHRSLARPEFKIDAYTALTSILKKHLLNS